MNAEDAVECRFKSGIFSLFVDLIALFDRSTSPMNKATRSSFFTVSVAKKYKVQVNNTLDQTKRPSSKEK